MNGSSSVLHAYFHADKCMSAKVTRIQGTDAMKNWSGHTEPENTLKDRNLFGRFSSRRCYTINGLGAEADELIHREQDYWTQLLTSATHCFHHHVPLMPRSSSPCHQQVETFRTAGHPGQFGTSPHRGIFRLSIDNIV